LLTADEIADKIKKAEKVLKEKFEKGELQTKGKDTHVLTQAK
jgi:hypothetical protein